MKWILSIECSGPRPMSCSCQAGSPQRTGDLGHPHSAEIWGHRATKCIRTMSRQGPWKSCAVLEPHSDDVRIGPGRSPCSSTSSGPTRQHLACSTRCYWSLAGCQSGPQSKKQRWPKYFDRGAGKWHAMINGLPCNLCSNSTELGGAGWVGRIELN